MVHPNYFIIKFDNELNSTRDDIPLEGQWGTITDNRLSSTKTWFYWVQTTT